MSRRTLVRKLERIFQKDMNTIKKQLRKEAKYVCTTSDIWSCHKKSFFGVTAHWVFDALIN